MTTQADRLFVEPGLEWRPVSPRLVTERRFYVLVLALVGAGFGVGGLLLWVNGFAVAGAVLLGVGAAWLALCLLLWFVVVPRVVRAWRYAEREQDLLVTRGRIQRRLTVVPYGRMQVIEVTSDPISSRLGIATVTLVTASATTDATIPGLPAAEAHELRDRLAAKGEALTAGL